MSDKLFPLGELISWMQKEGFLIRFPHKEKKRYKQTWYYSPDPSNVARLWNMVYGGVDNGLGVALPITHCMELRMYFLMRALQAKI